MPESQTPPNRTPPSGRAGASPPARSWRERLDAMIESGPVQGAVIAVIVANAITLGLQTSPAVLGAIGGPLAVLDALFLAVFVVELLLKLVARGPRFFLDGWNVFDFIVVGIALVPGTGPLAVLRALRVLRLVSAIPKLRFVVTALFAAIPGIASIGALLCIIFYVFAVMATGFFGAAFPEWFGSIGASLYSLFQIMTLESWSMGIVRPVMEVFPWAWAFFVPFILLSSFTILNLFIAVIVDTMQNLQDGRAERAEAEAEAEARRAGPEANAATEEPRGSSDEELAAELRRVRSRLDVLATALEQRLGRSGEEDSTR
ncbi:MAG: ion transporter [Pseudoclavibacter sp.]|nr:ion transporter [Pseudoclavibacter sp.]